MKNYRKTVLLGVLAIIIVPSVAFASWWNPFTWFKKNPPRQEQAPIATMTETPVQKSEETKPVPTVTTKKETKPITDCTKAPVDPITGSKDIGYFKCVVVHSDNIYQRESAQGWLDKNTSPQVKSSMALCANGMTLVSNCMTSPNTPVRCPAGYTCAGQTNNQSAQIPTPTIIHVNHTQYQPSPAPSQPQGPNCSNYQSEKNAMDAYYSQNGALFSSARTNAMAALEAKYASCF